jgi:hypothetical protein
MDTVMLKKFTQARRGQMSSLDPIINGVRDLLEREYLESVGDEPKDAYAGLSATEKRKTLKTFLQKLTVDPEVRHWAKRLEEIL